jgi:hypothetical protein
MLYSDVKRDIYSPSWKKREDPRYVLETEGTLSNLERDFYLVGY